MGEVLHGLLHPPTKKMWTKVVNEKIPRHPELVSGSIGGSESKSKRFRNKFGMTEETNIKKFLCEWDATTPNLHKKEKVKQEKKEKKNEAEKHN